MKLCTGCAHCHFDADLPKTSNYANCRNPIVATISPVDGKQPAAFCYLERTEHGKCGIDGRLFEATRVAA